MANRDWTSIKEEMIETEELMEREGLRMRMHGSMSVRYDEETIFFAGDVLRGAPFTQGQIRRLKLKRIKNMAAVHATIYKMRPDVNAVVFTRQCCGSTLGILKQDGLAAEDEQGNLLKIRVVPFVLPGSDAQRAHVRRLAAKEKDLGILITANHGVLAFGPTLRDAFASALTLERFGQLYLEQLAHTDLVCGVEHGYDSVREGSGIRFEADPPARVRKIHETIYAARPDVRAIVHNKSRAAATVSRICERLYPLFDDQVRLAGGGVPIPDGRNGEKTRDGIYVSQGSNVSFCRDDGAYCYGRSRTQAHFIAESVEKACIAQIAAARMEGAHVLGARDVRRLQRM